MKKKKIGCIVNNGTVNIAYQFEPDWDAEDISEEDRAEPVQARLLMVCLKILFVNATASVSFYYTTGPLNAWIWLADERSKVCNYFQGNARRM